MDMTHPVTKCIFCGAPNVTKEHVFSAWSHKYMGPRQTGRASSYQGYRSANGKEAVEKKLRGQLRDWQIKAVCGGDHFTCNNGWMRKLEDKARPILVRLIEGSPCILTASDQTTVAAWAALKAMVAGYGEGSWPTAHHTQRKRMKSRNLPPEKGWGIWIGNYERVRSEIGWASAAFLILPKKSKPLDKPATYYNSRSTTQVIGKLFIQVIHSPMPCLIERWRFPTPQQGALFRIWPVTPYSIRWPQAAFGDRDAERFATAFFDWLDRVAAAKPGAVRTHAPMWPPPVPIEHIKRGGR